MTFSFGTTLQASFSDNDCLQVHFGQLFKETALQERLPACRRLLFPLLHAEKGRLRNAIANRVPASRWQGILFRINCEIISG